MNIEQARALIRDTFTRPFEKNSFCQLVRNLLNHIDESKASLWTQTYIKAAFRDHVNHYERLATYTDPVGEKIDVLIIHLKQDVSLERARTLQRNFIADYLSTDRGQDKAAVLGAFVPKTGDNWRFSFIKRDFTTVTNEKNRVMVETELTPARRYSYLVGLGEATHTAQAQLIPLLMNDEQDPSVADIEQSFSVERVTKEFFEEYQTLYFRTKEALDQILNKDSSVRKDFKIRDISTVDFSKKLLGQIVFLYFLQKKGWFGVARDGAWNTGPRDFLRRLFKKTIIPYDNFFNDILEPLFYEALAKERDADYYSRFRCKIPFLNGGLFDPIRGYDWVHTDILLPDDLFSNAKFDGDDEATGILDIFDRYNFTVNESEPLEKEVAIDPEMLGQVFENLLDVKDRKRKGSFYTPREIVHYLCQQSLCFYLEESLINKCNRADIETFVYLGEQSADFEVNPTQRHENKRLPESIRENALEVDLILERITVCDPAIGSGAFPVGMLTEIVRAREALSRLPKMANQSRYDLKRHTIQNCLYGVDIDLGAVEIAKLRLWLSLVVDEDDIHQIKPLPNLDYKIMQGNSLIDQFEGVKLFDEKLLALEDKGQEEKIKELEKKIAKYSDEYLTLHQQGKLDKSKKVELEQEIGRLKKALTPLLKSADGKFVQQELGDFSKRSRQMLAELEILHKEFFNVVSRSRKEELQKRLDALEWEFMETTLHENSNETALKHLQELRRTSTKPFFLWKLHFMEVFKEKGGFDIVIGNPPYVRIQTLNEYDPSQAAYLKEHFISAGKGNFDLYVVFVERGLEQLHAKGHLAFILPHKFFNAQYGAPLRGLIANGKQLRHVVHFGDQQIFPGATNYVCLLFLAKAGVDECRWAISNDISIWLSTQHASVTSLSADRLTADVWNFAGGEAGPLFDKLQRMPIKLGDVADIFVGLQTSSDDVFILNFVSENDSTITLESKSLQRNWVFEKELIHPLVSGTDVSPYCVLPRRQFIIFPYRINNEHAELISLNELSKTWPRTAAYLKENRNKLEERESDRLKGTDKWHGYIYLKNMNRQNHKKLCVPRLVEYLHAGIDLEGTHFLDNVDVGGVTFRTSTDTLNLAYLLSLLNSKLLRWFFPYVSAPFRGGFRSANRQFLALLPFRSINMQLASERAEHDTLVNLVENILAAKRINAQAETSSWEREIDQIIYKLYGLTTEEIEIVEHGLNK